MRSYRTLYLSSFGILFYQLKLKGFSFWRDLFEKEELSCILPNMIELQSVCVLIIHSLGYHQYPHSFIFYALKIVKFLKYGINSVNISVWNDYDVLKLVISCKLGINKKEEKNSVKICNLKNENLLTPTIPTLLRPIIYIYALLFEIVF